jgi:hypothetical protein
MCAPDVEKFIKGFVMEIEISVSSSTPNEDKLVAFFKKSGCNPQRVHSPGSYDFECQNWDLELLKKAMKDCGWESQGKGLFPSNDEGTAYFIQKKGDEQLCCLTPEPSGLFYMAFNGY